MKKLTKKEVFELINEEREYQNSRWTCNEDSKLAVSDWLIFIRKYLNSAENAIFEGDEVAAMAAIRKISTLGITAMEHKGCPSRIKNLV